MTNKRLTRAERETHFYLNEEENKWYADSFILRDINKLKKQGWELISEDYYKDGSVAHARFVAPRHALSIRKAEKLKRKLSEEQREALSKRMKNIHNQS